MNQFLKYGFGGVAALALVITFTVGRSSPPQATAAEKEAKFDEAWTDIMKVTALKKADMERRAATEPKPVITEAIAPDPPSVIVPPLVKLAEPVKRAATEHRRRHVGEQNTCTRHKMRKVMTRGGKSWRCKK